MCMLTKSALTILPLRRFASSNARRLLSKSISPEITITFFFFFVSDAVIRNRRRQLKKCGGSRNSAKGETVARMKERKRTCHILTQSPSFSSLFSTAVTTNRRRQLNKCGGSRNSAEGETAARERRIRE